MNSLLPSAPQSSSRPRPPVNPNQRYPNPSFGLTIWGPLVPASDCRECLYTLSGLQILGGLMFWWLPGRSTTRPAASNLPSSLNNFPQPSLSTSQIWRHRIVRTGGVLCGSYLIFLAGLELIRLQLPADPWADDAAAARAKAVGEGQTVSRWLGPLGYRAVEYRDWKSRIDATLAKVELAQQKAIASKSIYTDIRDSNRATASKILHDQLRDLEFQEPPLTKEEAIDFGDHLDAWDGMDPWENLRQETDIQIRLIPHTRGVMDESIVMETSEKAHPFEDPISIE